MDDKINQFNEIIYAFEEALNNFKIKVGTLENALELLVEIKDDLEKK